MAECEQDQEKGMTEPWEVPALKKMQESVMANHKQCQEKAMAEFVKLQADAWTQFVIYEIWERVQFWKKQDGQRVQMQQQRDQQMEEYKKQIKRGKTGLEFCLGRYSQPMSYRSLNMLMLLYGRNTTEKV